MDPQKSRQVKKIKLAIFWPTNEKWTFGNVYLKDLLTIIGKHLTEQIELFFFVYDEKPVLPEISELEHVKIIILQCPNFKNALLKKIFSFGYLRDIITKIQIRKALEHYEIDVLFGPGLDIKYTKAMIMSWLPDFQHIHLPEMFSDNEKGSRERLFKSSARHSSRVILMSNAVKEDFNQFAPDLINKVRLFPPTCNIPDEIYHNDTKKILETYNLPEKFFFLPNQFWKHKNHGMVLKSVKELNRNGVKVTLVCAGNPFDYRHPTYIAQLFLLVSQWNIRDQFIYIGLIPRTHVLELMRQSICVLNPSLFEGYGYTVDEANSIGKKLLISDIPSHREQKPAKAVFFDPYNIEDLTSKMATIWLNTLPGPDTELERAAMMAYPIKLEKNGQIFLSILQEALDERKR
jgi:glycosyltransferase involved in cell wall biosynthesis